MGYLKRPNDSQKKGKKELNFELLRLRSLRPMKSVGKAKSLTPKVSFFIKRDLLKTDD